MDEIKNLEAMIEAILFTLGEAIECERIAAAVGHDVETVRRVIHRMMDLYEAQERGIQIIELEDSYQMCTKSSMYEALIRITNVPKNMY